MPKLRPRLDVLLAAALIAAVATQAAPASAQDYPNRPITLVVPFPPGGSATIIARAIADKLGDALGQQIVIDNRGGAGGSIGARQVAKSAPDGTTILLAFTGTLAVSPIIFPNVGYDPRRDFAAIGLIGMAPSVLAVHPSVAAHSVADLISAAKAAPGKIQFGSPGSGRSITWRGNCWRPWPTSRSPISPTRASARRQPTAKNAGTSMA
jgi:tripartite-type tricarboxylate transporter receptor subunit TctC